MKKILILTVAMLFVASTAFGLVIGSKHDMASTTYNAASTLSTCQFCHTPHHAGAAAVAGMVPLWNRSMPGTSYTVYDSGAAGGNQTLNDTAVNQPGKHSLACLSCHDGQVSVGDVVIGTDDASFEAASALGASGLLDVGSPGYFGTDISKEHPVGIAYTEGNTAGLATGTIAPYRAYDNGTGQATTNPTSGTHRVECGSCHDPHNTTAGQTPFLRGAKATLCTTCHSLK